MKAGAQSSLLADGRRLHLHHGPIDLIIEVFGPDRDACYARANKRFESILSELVADLPALRQPLLPAQHFDSPVARRMAQALRPYHAVFVTPMAAVAGAVADEVLAEMLRDTDPAKAYVNNGGDVAFHLGKGEAITAQSAAGPLHITAQDPVRGIATSGWKGRSHSLGIADAVTVTARCAAAADVAATLIANAVDLPGHPAITRQPANHLSPDSDLGPRLVTTDVGPLSQSDVTAALTRGTALAERLCRDGHIAQAALGLQGQYRFASAHPSLEGTPAHA